MCQRARMRKAGSLPHTHTHIYYAVKRPTKNPNNKYPPRDSTVVKRRPVKEFRPSLRRRWLLFERDFPGTFEPFSLSDCLSPSEKDREVGEKAIPSSSELLPHVSSFPLSSMLHASELLLRSCDSLPVGSTNLNMEVIDNFYSKEKEGKDTHKEESSANSAEIYFFTVRKKKRYICIYVYIVCNVCLRACARLIVYKRLSFPVC